MNCRKGDLAVIVSASAGMEWTIGHICRVIRAAVHPTGAGAGWIFEPPVERPGVWFNAALDSRLRPIRDPGPDAVDETLMGKPAPVLEEVAS